MQKDPITKYRPFPKVDLPERQWPNKAIDKAPIWCSVDLRDGNQALAVPMNVQQKLEFFELLLKIGFREIEVGFPSASQTEFNFMRRLIEEKRIPDGVSIQFLTQAREHLIRRSFESIRGAKEVIAHLYNSTSPLQRDITFGMSKEQIKNIAIEGAKLVKKLTKEVPDTKIRYQYSPESFSDTEVDFSLEICEAVMDVFEPTEKDKIIINLPDTVEWAGPHVYADQIEWFCRNMKERNKAIISLHTHNDRGTGVAATELGLLAGAERVEGTLFGNGERTGNLDIVTVALNMYMHGVDPKLDFSDMPAIKKVYEHCIRMPIHERHPYAGDLVFTAFSGSHQDAIKKGMDRRKEQPDEALWRVPYLTIDPEDIGQSYQAIIRINSQSGKGGVAYILQQEYGFDLPKSMHPEIGQIVNNMADKLGVELSNDQIFGLFQKEYIDQNKPLDLVNFEQSSIKGQHEAVCSFDVTMNGQSYTLDATGNGPINAFVHALEKQGWKNFNLTDFRQHAISSGSDSQAAAYVQLKKEDGTLFWGVGLDENISMAGLKALACAYNRANKSVSR